MGCGLDKMLAPLIRGSVVFFPGREEGGENKKNFLWDDHGVHTTTQQAAQCDIFFAKQQSNKACLGMSHTKYSTSHFKRKRNSMKVLLYVVGAEGTTNAVYL